MLDGPGSFNFKLRTDCRSQAQTFLPVYSFPFCENRLESARRCVSGVSGRVFSMLV